MVVKSSLLSLNVAGIILAAGASLRFGKPKQLLPWGNSIVINNIIMSARIANLTPIVVVLGANIHEIQTCIEDKGSVVVCNSEWNKGQSQSIRIGLATLPENVIGAVFLLADQPQISPRLIEDIVLHGKQYNEIIIPVIAGRRANPVYFPKHTFSTLAKLSGDQGGRAIFSQFRTRLMDWLDDDMAYDIDTVEDYMNLREKFGIKENELDKV